MADGKGTTFVSYSSTLADRAKSRRIINRHVSRLRDFQSQRDREQEHSSPHGNPNIDVLPVVNGPNDAQLQSNVHTLLTKAIGISSLPTSPKPACSTTSRHHPLTNRTCHDNATLAPEPPQNNARTAATTHQACFYDLMFHALVAWTLGTMPESQDRTSLIRQHLLFHRDETLKQLQICLAQGLDDDILIQSICLMLPIDDHLEYTEFTEAHLKCIEQMTHRRGIARGYAPLRSSGPALGLQLTTAVSISSTKLSINTALSLRDTSKIDTSSTPSLHYPACPFFTPSFTTEISHLPAGFADLVLAGRPSVDMITIVADFGSWLLYLHQFSTSESGPKAYHFSVPSGLGTLEQHICTALISLTDDLPSKEPHFTSLIFRKPLMKARILWEDLYGLGRRLPTPRDDQNNSVGDEILVWLATVVSTPTTNTDLAPKELRTRLYGRLVGNRPWLRQWQNVEETLRRFCYSGTRVEAWNVNLEDASD